MPLHARAAVACLADVRRQGGLTIVDRERRGPRSTSSSGGKRQRATSRRATPIVVGESIFISSGYQQGAGLYRFDDDGSVTEVFRTRAMRNKMSGCVLWEDHFYGFDESMLKCLDMEGQ